jgi:hypothetical protein
VSCCRVVERTRRLSPNTAHTSRGGR